MSNFDFDVSIVGYGPVGATLSALLSEMGLKVGVFEKNEHVYPKPRAVGFDHDAMRIFQQIQCASLLRPAVSDFKSTVYLGASGQVIQKILTLSPPYPLTWEPHFNCDQPLLEELIREKNLSRKDLTVYLNHEIRSIEQSSGHVEITCIDSIGDVRTFRSLYLVGCDGASSFVRKSMNSKLESLDYDQHWIVVDMLIDDHVLERFPQHNIQFCEPSRPTTYIVCPKNHRRWEFMSLQNDPKQELLSEDFIWLLLKRWLLPHEAKIWRSASYRFHALIAQNWVDDRVLLCGDAAHQTPPFMGQGMCQGIRDAGNLAWKLSGVIQSGYHRKVLQSYTDERRPHVIETTVLAKKLGEILTVLDPIKAQERDQRLILQGHGKPLEMVRQNLIPPLRAGIFDFQGECAGEVFPQSLVTDRNGGQILMDDIEKFKFKVVMMLEHQSFSIIQAFANLQLPILLLSAGTEEDFEFDASRSQLIHVYEVNQSVSNYLKAKNLIGALVRPDHYIYAGFRDMASAQKIALNFQFWLSDNLNEEC